MVAVSNQVKIVLYFFLENVATGESGVTTLRILPLSISLRHKPCARPLDTKLLLLECQIQLGGVALDWRPLISILKGR